MPSRLSSEDLKKSQAEGKGGLPLCQAQSEGRILCKVCSAKGANNKVYIICLIGLIFLGVGTLACPDSPKTPEKTDEKTTSLPPPAASPTPRQKPELLFSLRVHESSGAVSELQLKAEAEFEIEPSQRVEIIANQKLVDFRARLMDAQERVLPSDEEMFFDTRGTVVDIQLLSPLKPANSLILLMDSQMAHKISNDQGDSYDDFRITLKVRGEPEKPAPKPKTPPKKPKKTPKKKVKKPSV